MIKGRQLRQLAIIRLYVIYGAFWVRLLEVVKRMQEMLVVPYLLTVPTDRIIERCLYLETEIVCHL